MIGTEPERIHILRLRFYKEAEHYLIKLIFCILAYPSRSHQISTLVSPHFLLKPFVPTLK